MARVIVHASFVFVRLPLGDSFLSRPTNNPQFVRGLVIRVLQGVWPKLAKLRKRHIPFRLRSLSCFKKLSALLWYVLTRSLFNDVETKGWLVTREKHR